MDKGVDTHWYWRNRAATGKNGHLDYVGVLGPERARSKWLADIVTGMGLPMDAEICELGCGCGRNLWFLMHRGFRHLYGVEANLDRSIVARLTTGRPIWPGDLASATNLGPFDLTFTMAVLMHVKDVADIEKVAEMNSSRFLAVEAEKMPASSIHFPRGYKPIFESRGWRQIETWTDIPGLAPDAYVARLFEKAR